MSDYVLVVDDSPDVRAVMVDVLSEYGVPTRQAANGQEALAIVQAEPPLAIVMGLKMPVMDGFTTLSHMQRNPDTQHIPVILLSAQVDRTTRYDGLPGVVGVMSKDEFSVDALLDLLAQVGVPITHWIE